MPDREPPTPAGRTLSLRLPARVRVPAGSSLLLASGTATTIATGRAGTTTSAWQLVVLTVAAMATDVALAATRRRERG
jgi:hypothetical protein